MTASRGHREVCANPTATGPRRRVLPGHRYAAGAYLTYSKNAVDVDGPMTDAGGNGRKMEGHHAVNHARREFVRGQWHVNTVEGFFGLFKRAIVGVWHWISGKHLHRYANEHGFRWNHREDVANRIARCLIGQHGRLSWKELVQ